MKNQGISDLFFYWNQLRGESPAPDRRQIEPVDIRSYLADTFILEFGMRQEVTFRLAGTRICAIFGRELKHFSFYSLFSLNDISLVRRLVQSCFRDKSVSVVRFDGITKEGRTLGFEAIFLPLSGEADGARLFGAVFPDEKPYWLGVDPIVESRLTSIRVIDPDKEQVLGTNKPSISLGVSRADISANKAGHTAVPPVSATGRAL